MVWTWGLGLDEGGSVYVCVCVCVCVCASKKAKLCDYSDADTTGINNTNNHLETTIPNAHTFMCITIHTQHQRVSVHPSSEA
jgi:hypothetical protein